MLVTFRNPSDRKSKHQKRKRRQTPACNPSYSGGRDQEDHSSKPGWVNSSARPYLKKTFTKTGLVE
jgi:hypothetical protein